MSGMFEDEAARSQSMRRSMTDMSARFPADDDGDVDGRNGSDEITYDRQRARAEARESVRRFVSALEGLRDESLSYRGLQLDSIDRMLRYVSLNEWRLVVYRLFVLLPFLTLIVAVGVGEFQASLDLPQGWTVAGANSSYWTAGAVMVVVGIIVATIVVRFRIDRYKTVTQQQMHEIEQRITQRMSDLQNAYSAAQGAFKVEISPNQKERPFKEAIIEMFRCWRELERLPIYLRHDFDEYFNQMSDAREFGARRGIRLWTLGAFLVLTLVTVLSAVAITMPVSGGLWALVQGQPDLWVFGAFGGHVLFVVMAVVSRPRHRWQFDDYAGLIAALFTLGIVSVAVLRTLSGTEPVDAEALGFAAQYLATTSILASVAMFVAGEIYKGFTDELVVDLVRALKTHKKAYAIGLTRHGFKDWLKDTKGSANDWNGWTPEYEAGRRRKLEEEGLDPDEIDIRIGCDPVIYVGNEKNRRLQAADTDLVSSFYKRLPVVRQ